MTNNTFNPDIDQDIYRHTVYSSGNSEVPFRSCNGHLWDQLFYLRLEEEVHPFKNSHRFRSLNQAYTGNNTFWATPSPEPDLADDFWRGVTAAFNRDNALQEIAQNLATAILKQYPDPDKIVFVSILRAGVPVTDWLCRLLPGAVGVATSLFVGLGIDTVALNRICTDFPDRSIVFVDGWTGRGGVASVISALHQGPLAVLIDPWGWADFSGIQEDVLCPSACFTGLATLGFSRTFFVDQQNCFSAYRFPETFLQHGVVQDWQRRCPADSSLSLGWKGEGRLHKFFEKTPLRIHSNEVCRALINAAPETLFFLDDTVVAEEKFNLLLELAAQRSVPVEFNVAHLKALKTKVACRLAS